MSVFQQIGLPLRGRPILLISRMITDRIGIHSVLLPFYTQYLVVPTRKAILSSKSAYLICDSPWERQSFIPLQKSRQITVLLYEQNPYQV